jgi:hypothetical protein
MKNTRGLCVLGLLSLFSFASVQAQGWAQFGS